MKYIVLLSCILVGMIQASEGDRNHIHRSVFNLQNMPPRVYCDTPQSPVMTTNGMQIIQSLYYALSCQWAHELTCADIFDANDCCTAEDKYVCAMAGGMAVGCCGCMYCCVQCPQVTLPASALIAAAAISKKYGLDNKTD